MFFNQRGSTLLFSLIAAGFISASTMFILERIQNTNKMSALPRVRSNMLQTELQVRNLALSPSTYPGCTAAVGSTSCQFLKEGFENLSNKWAKVTNVSFDRATQHFHAEIESNYARAEAKPRIIDMEIPREVLTEISFSCPDATPFYMGLDSQGKMICRAAPNVGCGDGNYVLSINADTLTPVCSPIGTVASCPYGEKISSFNWLGGMTVNVGCMARPLPVMNALTTATTTTTVPTTTLMTTTTMGWSTTTYYYWDPGPYTDPYFDTTTMTLGPWPPPTSGPSPTSPPPTTITTTTMTPDPYSPPSTSPPPPDTTTTIAWSPPPPPPTTTLPPPPPPTMPPTTTLPPPPVPTCMWTNGSYSPGVNKYQDFAKLITRLGIEEAHACDADGSPNCDWPLGDCSAGQRYDCNETECGYPDIHMVCVCY